jgi:hypothetical protein
MILRTLAFLSALASVQGAASAGTARVPAVMLGTWAHGSCAAQGNRLVITPSTAKLGTGKAAAVVYRPDDQGPGRGALHWNEEYVVDNFVYDSTQKAIVHNTQGFGMPGQMLYKRCPAAL